MSEYLDDLRRQQALIRAIKDQDIDLEAKLLEDMDPNEINMLYKNATSDALINAGLSSSELIKDPYIKNMGYNIKIQDPRGSVMGWHSPKTKEISTPDMMPDTLLHELAHVEDTRSGYKSKKVEGLPNSEILPKTGMAAAQIAFSGHHQLSPMVSKEILHNIIAGNKFYESADISESSGNTDPIYKEKLKNLMLAN